MIWGPFLESSETFRAHFGWHNSLCIFRTKVSRGTKLRSYFNYYPLYNIWEDQLHRISGSEFYKWLFGPEKFSGLSRNGPLEQYTRRECVEIRGISVAANPSEEQTNNIVKDVSKLLGWILLKTRYQLAIEFLKGKPGPPAIIVKFMRCDVKDNFYCARKQLKDLTTQDLGYSEENKIYHAESLTKRNWMLFKDCLKVKKDMKFLS